MRRAPSTPDTSVKQHFLGHAWIEALYSRTQRYRAVITRDAGPVYRVYGEQWDDSDWAEWGTAVWVPGETKSFTDTIDRAREIEGIPRSNAGRFGRGRTRRGGLS